MRIGRETVVVPGDLKINIKEWVVPTLGSRPHDPYAAPDGTIYWAGMWGNVIGHVDPKTGAIKEYPLPTVRTGPHGLTMDKEGNIWFAGNFGGILGKLDPKTGEVKEYKMPDPAARDPHTPLFDKKGMLWFTLQNSNMVGRLNPATGEIKLVTMPTAAVAALRHGDDVGRQPVHLRVRREPAREVRPRHDGHHRVHAAERGVASAPPDDHRG